MKIPKEASSGGSAHQKIVVDRCLWGELSSFSSTAAFLQNSLDRSQNFLLKDNDAVSAIRCLTDSLSIAKANSPKADWSTILIPMARNHTISELIYQCPLTRHSSLRPRGYPGDADLLDLIYRHPSALPNIEGATAVGKAIFDVTSTVSACEAVRQRRNFAAVKIDETIERFPGAEIMSLACGNLREAELSQRLQEQQISSFSALDQDEISLETVKIYGQMNRHIAPKKITVRDILSDKHNLKSQHLIYSVGLYDYLQDKVASRLTKKLFDLLKSGGTLLVANFLNDIWEAPYMEAYMDWHLIYRDENTIRAFASEIDGAKLGSISYTEDATRCIGYLEISRV